MDKMASDSNLRVFCDGCYDVYHYGHANQFLQAKRMGTYLAAGIHPDEIIIRNKGPPVITERDRYAMIRSIRFVDDVVEGIGYDITPQMLDKAGCDICVHGDDVVITDAGNDAYAAIKKQDRYRTCKRTRGISTTELVGRMLLLTLSHHSESSTLDGEHFELARELAMSSSGTSPLVTVVQYNPDTPSITEVINGRPIAEAPHQRRVIYVEGNFDLFHIGHLNILKAASARGDYLIAGIHSDRTTNSYKGQNYPIMNFHERVLTVLPCRYVDAILLDAPYVITEKLISDLRIDLVLRGKTTVLRDPSSDDPYAIPKSLDRYSEIDSGSDMSTALIVERIIQNRLDYELRNNRSQQKEKAALEAALAKLEEAKRSHGHHLRDCHASRIGSG